MKNDSLNIIGNVIPDFVLNADDEHLFNREEKQHFIDYICVM